MNRRRPAPGAWPDPPVEPDPEQAWKTLSLVNGWLRHAEGKLGLVLAGSGVCGGLLFNLVKGQTGGSAAFKVAAVVCGAAVIGAGLCAIGGLFPVVKFGRRRRAAEKINNPMFFYDIARDYGKDAPGYESTLLQLTANPKDLIRHIAQQVWANAHVAQRKYWWAQWATRSLLVGLAALGAVAAITILKL